MESIRAVSERMQLMQQAAAVLGASMQRLHGLGSSESITKKELNDIIDKAWSENSQLLKSLDEKKVNPEAQWITKSDTILSSLLFPENGRLYFLELLLKLTETGRFFNHQLVYVDVTLEIDRVKEAQIKEKQPHVSVVTLQHLRDEPLDSSMPDHTRNQLMLDYVNLTLVTTQRAAPGASASETAVSGTADASIPAPRRNTRRKSDLPTWERNPWLPVRFCLLPASRLFLMLAVVTGANDCVWRRQ
jgi:hypothetical protein